MSFIYSRALVEEFSQANCSGTDVSALLSSSPTHKPCLWHDKTTGLSPLSRFGMTCAPLTESHGAALLTWFVGDSRVRTYQLPGMVPASMASAPVSGEKWPESSVRYDPSTSSWKTHLCLWEEGLPWSSVTLPSWGMTRSGFVYQHPTAERPISGTDSGLWPTPTVCGNYNRPYPGKQSGYGLATAVRTWPTPVASMSKGSSPASLTRKSGADRSNDRLDHAVMASDGGQLNPDWVEWLMGWPIGHTDLKPLATGRYREWLQQHSPCLQQKEAA